MDEIARTLQQAIALHQQGQLPRAEALYRQILEQQPGHPDALHLLGLIAHAGARNDEARGLIERAIAAQPRNPLFHFNLGTLCLSTGDLGRAADAFRQAIDLKPDYADAYNSLGSTLRQLGRDEEAVESYRTALGIRPDDLNAYRNLGNIQSDDPGVLRSLAETYKEHGDHARAAECLRRLMRHKPDDADAHHTLGRVLELNHDFEAAINAYRRAIDLEDDRPEFYDSLCNALCAVDKLDSAIECFSTSIPLRTDQAKALYQLGNLYRQRGRIDTAVEQYRNALRLRSNYGAVYGVIIRSGKKYYGPDDIKAMEGLLDDGSLSESDRAHLCFGLGTACERSGDYPRAFRYFDLGNSIKRRSFNHDEFNSGVSRFAEEIAAIEETFDEKLFAARPAHDTGDVRPVFIVSMPRAGSTLTEQILSMHPQVYGAGEVKDLYETLFGGRTGLSRGEYPRCVPRIDADSLARFASDYITRLRRFSHDHPYITNKSPGNFIHIGMIKLLFPHARVIHCKRDPVDTCLSCFKTYFGEEGHFYSYDQTTLGGYYRLYERLMRHWHKVLPGFVHDIVYEDLVSDQETQVRRMLEFCGLPWDEACMKFYDSDRAVASASDVQVRRPIYNQSVNRWRNYRPYLAPLIQALGLPDED